MSFDSAISSVLATPISEFESPFAHSRTSSINSVEVRQPRFPGVNDVSGRRGSAAGQHDLVIQAQKGLGPSLKQGEHYHRRPKVLNQYDLQSQARYGLGPTVSLKDRVMERRGSEQYDLISQAKYGLGPTVPSGEAVIPRRVDAQYDLGTQQQTARGSAFSMRNPYGAQQTQQTHDLSSQYRRLM